MSRAGWRKRKAELKRWVPPGFGVAPVEGLIDPDAWAGLRALRRALARARKRKGIG